MKNKLLLPASFKLPGLVLLLLSVWLFIATLSGFMFSFLQTGHPKAGNKFDLSFKDYNLTNECAYLGMLAGLIAIAFARVAGEDERITFIRLQSLQVSHYLSYAIFAIGLLVINGLSFLVSLFAMPYIFLVTFILVFYCRLYLLPKFAAHEEQS